jgi:hypothetical protein
MVKIFRRAADQQKKGHCERNLSPPNAFSREIETILATHDTVEGFNTKQPSLEATYHNLSSLSRFIFAKYNAMKNEAKASTS